MTSETDSMGALDGIRVIDFGHYVAGPVAGMLLADQGADVIKVDPPWGPEFNSTGNATWNRGKRGICLDLKNAEDALLARKLVQSADVTIENFRPGVMDRLGLGEQSCRRENPGLVYASMPGFAAEDPRSVYPAWEGVILAATDVFRPLAEYRNMVQVLHKPPSERIGDPQFTDEPMASMYAAMVCVVATATALNVRADTGVGQRVEVPLFDAMMQAVGVFAMARLPYRPITRSVFSGFDHQYQCADGRWVHIVCTVPRHAELFAAAVDAPEMIEQGMTARGAGANESLNNALTESLTEIFATRTADEWESLFVELGIPGAKCRSTEEWMEHPQAVESDLFVTVQDLSLGRMRQPGIQVKLSVTPGSISGPAPVLDADRDRILEDIGRPKARAEAALPAAEIDGLPLQGLRVLDLCIILAGPTCGRTLAEFGADVIKIDDPDRGEVAYHHDINRGKRTILLDLKSGEGLQVFWQLVETADVIVQNYRSGVVERLGIDYESVKLRRPDVIYVSLNAYGDTGPWAQLPGYEESVQALTGMQVRYGGSKTPTLWPYGVVNDYGTGYAGAYGALLALLSRAQTGEGQHVTSGLARTAGTLQSSHLSSYTGEDTSRELRGSAPEPLQRLYECSDGWIFVGVRSAQELVQACGLSREDNAELDMEVWCESTTAHDGVATLNAEGIGAHALEWMNDVVGSNAVSSRGLSVVREHQRLGAMRTTGPAQWLSASRTRPGRPAPLPGNDAQTILDDIGRAHDLAGLIERGVIRVPRR